MRLKLWKCEVDYDKADDEIWINNEESDSYIPILLSEVPKLIEFLKQIENKG